MVERTARGFAIYLKLPIPTRTLSGSSMFSVQESSSANGRMVWIGTDDGRAHLSVDEAIQVRDALIAFIEDVPLPTKSGQYGNFFLASSGDWFESIPTPVSREYVEDHLPKELRSLPSGSNS